MLASGAFKGLTLDRYPTLSRQFDGAAISFGFLGIRFRVIRVRNFLMRMDQGRW